METTASIMMIALLLYRCIGSNALVAFVELRLRTRRVDGAQAEPVVDLLEACAARGRRRLAREGGAHGALQVGARRLRLLREFRAAAFVRRGRRGGRGWRWRG